MPQRRHMRYTPDEVEQLRNYCEEGRDLEYIRERMQRNPGAITEYMWKLVKSDPSWKSFARKYSREYSHQLRQRPLDQEAADSLLRHLMEYPEASTEELQGAGHGKTLSQYPGGIHQARKDAESRRFLEAYEVYNKFIADVTDRAEAVRREEFSSSELKLVRVVFGEIPHFVLRDGQFGSYVTAYVHERRPSQGLEDYRSRILSDLKGIFQKEMQQIMGEGKLRELINEALGSLKPRERRVIELRFLAERWYTLKEIGNLPEFDVTSERIRQIEVIAMRKLRHPSRSRKLQYYFKDKRLEMLKHHQDTSSNPDAELFYGIIDSLESQVQGLQLNVSHLEEEFVSESGLRQRLRQLERQQRRVEPADSVPLSYLGLIAEERLVGAGITTVDQLKQLPDYELGKIMFSLSDLQSFKRKLESYEKAQELGISVSEEPIERLELRASAATSLKRAGIARIWELQTMTEDEVLSLKNIGITHLRAIKEKLADRGLKLREE